jgi:PAS domain S-box-containing protein
LVYIRCLMRLLSHIATVGAGVPDFLAGGGEMGALTRAFDWPATPVGAIGAWPQSLRTTVSIILNSKFPMFLWWGNDLIQFYNDAYRPSLGKDGKHPLALGQKGEDCWPEIWPIIKPLIDQVRQGGEATWSEDQLIPIYRNGKIEDVYWTFSYSPVRDENGKVGGVLVVCNESTEKVIMVSKLQLSDQRFQNLVREATVGIIVLHGPEMRVDIVNEAYGRLINCTPEGLLGKQLFDVIPQAAAYYKPLLQRVLQTGEPIYLYDSHYVVNTNGTEKSGYVNVVYQPYREVDGTITGVMAICTDVTEGVLAKKKMEEAQVHIQNTADRLQLAIDAGELGSFELDIESGIIDCTPQCRLNCGFLSDELFTYEKLIAAIVPEDKAGIHEALQRSISGHATFNAEYRVRWNDGPLRWVRAAGNPVYNGA